MGAALDRRDEVLKFSSFFFQLLLELRLTLRLSIASLRELGLDALEDIFLNFRPHQLRLKLRQHLRLGDLRANRQPVRARARAVVP